MAAARWLVDLSIGGTIYRYATTEGPIARAGGGADWLYHGGLAPLSIGMVSPPGGRSLALSLATGEDWAAVEARGARLIGAHVTVRLWRSGALEAASIRYRGTVTSRTIGRRGEPLQLTATSAPTIGAAVVPPPSASVGPFTWPITSGLRLNPATSGKPYPVIIGAPGHHPGPGVSYPAAGTPMIMAEAHPTLTSGTFQVLSLGHVHATTLRLSTPDDSFQIDKPIVTAIDSLGRIVSGIRDAVDAQQPDLEYWAGLEDSAGYGGGILNPYGPGMLRGAGDIMRWVLESQTDAIVDSGAMVAAASWLNRWRIDASITEAANMMEWLEAEVLSLVPVLTVEGPHGMYFAPLRWDAIAADVVLALTADMVERSGPLVELDAARRNHLTLEYRPLRDSGGYSSYRTLTADFAVSLPVGLAHLTMFADGRVELAPVIEPVKDQIASPYCRASQALYGRIDWASSSDVVWDDATAILTLDYLALRYALPKRAGQYIGSPDDLGDIRPGDVVRISDPDLYISAAIAIVLEVTTDLTVIVLDVVYLDDPYTTPVLTI